MPLNIAFHFKNKQILFLDATQIEYNDASMIERVIDAKGTGTLNVEYSILGEVLAETDALSNVTSYGYDELSRLTSVTDPLDRYTQYTYDGADNIVSVMDANNNVVNYEYNTKGLLTKEIDPLGNEESYKYFVDGLLEKITKADGTTSIYSYDLAGRMTDVKYSDGTEIDYGYNEVGSTTTMVDRTGTTTYQYDDMQRLVSTTDSNDKTVSYEYDILGRRTNITLPDGQSTSYEYDVLDRLIKVLDDSTATVEYEYNANSQLVSNVRNDITTVYEYNELGQIGTLTTSKLQENMMQFEYEYDKIGNIVSEVRTEENAINTRAYEYDATNQLTAFTDNDYAEAYTYDNVGNMLNKSINDVATSYTYNNGNQLINELTDSSKIDYTYNSNGDLISKSTGEQYSYDIQGNLTAIVGNGIEKQYTYNGAGNRLSETTDGETIFYVNDLNRRYEEVLQTYGEDGKVINTYTYGVQRISSVGVDNETYLYDGRGSVVGSVSDDVITSYAYTAYGDLMPQSPEPNVFGYNAEATDYTTGMQYLRARYYATTVQRFVQEDDYRGKFTRPSSMNRYIYCEGNPIVNTDPSGYSLNRTIGQRILTDEKNQGIYKLPPIRKPSDKEKYGLTDGGSGMTAQDHRLAKAMEQRLEDEQDIQDRADAERIAAEEVAAAAEAYRCAMATQQEEEETKWWQTETFKIIATAVVAVAAVALIAVTAGAAAPLIAAGIGAVVGGAAGVGVTAYKDYKDDGQLNATGGSYIKSFVGGAVAGALIGALGAVAASAVASGAATLGTGMLAMGLAGTTTGVVRQQITSGEINYVQAAIEGVATALTFGLFQGFQMGLGKSDYNTITPRGNDFQNMSQETFDEAYGVSNSADSMSPNDLVTTHSLTLSQNKYNNLKGDIQVNGINESVKYIEHNGNNYIVDGHHRVAIAKELGTTVPVEQVQLPYKGYKTVADLVDWGVWD